MKKGLIELKFHRMLPFHTNTSILKMKLVKE